MIKKLPGSTIEVDISREGAADTVFTPMFLAGGLMLSQVAQVSGLEPHVIQNWVKRGFLSSPQGKKYSRRQLSRILIINTLRDTLQLDKICAMLSYINGHLDKESDDIIDDTRLYLYVAELTAELERNRMNGADELDSVCDRILQDYTEPFKGARDRVKLVLLVVVEAYAASHFKQKAEQLLSRMEL